MLLIYSAAENDLSASRLQSIVSSNRHGGGQGDPVLHGMNSITCLPVPGERAKGVSALWHSGDTGAENQLWFNVKHPEGESGIKLWLTSYV